MDPQLQQLLQQLGATAGNTSGAMQQLISALAKASAANNSGANAANLQAQALQQLQSRTQNVTNGLQGLMGTGTGLVNSFTSVTASVYGADKAFTSVIPTLDAMSNLFNRTVTAAGQLASGVTVFGMSFGRASEAISSGATAAMDILTGQLRFQLESAQKVADSFLEVGKAGATFGGSITDFAEAAKSAKTPLLEFGRFIAQNTENLSKLGTSITGAAKLAIAFGRDIFGTNDVLVALYKNIEGLSQGAAEYLALQNQLGYAGVRSTNLTKAAVEEYLVRQKELTALTGKNAETLKREEEERRKQLDYQRELARMTPEQRENAREAQALAAKVFGEAGEKYAREFISTRGNVIDPQMLAYRATNFEAVRAIENLVDGIKKPTEDFRTQYSNYFKANADAITGEARSFEDLAAIARIANNNILTQATSAAAVASSSETLLREMDGTIQEFRVLRNRMRGDMPLDDATQAFVNAERNRSSIQQEIDKTTLQNMTKIGGVVDFLNTATLKMVEQQRNVGEILQKLKNAMDTGFSINFDEFANDMKKFLNDTLRNMGVGPAATPPPRPADVPRDGATELPPSAAAPAIPTVAQAAPAAPESTAIAVNATLLQGLGDRLVAAVRTNNEENNNSRANELASQLQDLRTQMTNLVTNNNNAAEVVAVLTQQSTSITTQNSKIDDLIAVNRQIFEALA